ncbi:MAG TPA: hypothetical protein VMW41_04270 [Candidatus Bathyarchaeia archaeon]|nr:hypothetical protein [Candidatus Bathyarchaeia archaeon]
MFRQKAPVYSAVLLIYLGLVTFLRWQFKIEIVFFWLGGFAGLLLYNLDQVVYLVWQDPNSLTTGKLKTLVNQRRFKESLDLLSDTCDERKHLVAHSVVFQIALVALTFFAISSTASLFGKGLVIGLFLYSLINQGLLLVQGKSMACWFWQLGIKLTRRAEACYFLSLVIILFLFTLLLI